MTILVGAKNYTVLRRNGGSYIDGIWTNPASTTLTVKMAVQVEEDGLVQTITPEGFNRVEKLKAYSGTFLQTIKQDGPEKADRVQVNGLLYEVQKRENWDEWSNDVAHYKYVLVEMDDQVEVPSYRSPYEIAIRACLVVALPDLDPQKIIFLNEPGPELKGAYATVDVRPPATQGAANGGYVDAVTDGFVIKSFKRGLVEIQIFGTGHRENLDNMYARVEKDPAFNIKEHENGVAISTASGIEPLELSPVEDTGFDRRSVAELVYTLGHELALTITPIESTEITVTPT